MLQEVKDLQNKAVSQLIQVIKENKKEFTFKAPTGSGKTFMMADFMNRILHVQKDVIFIVSTLSKSNLAEQNYNSFKELAENGTFSEINPFLINSESSGEGSLYIPTDYNVYVLPRDLYKDKSKLKNEGTFLNFLQTMRDSLFSESKGKRIILIKDECHIATNNLDELYDYFETVINFSATPKLSRKQNPDVEITNIEAESCNLIKKVELGSEESTLNEALDVFEKVQKDYVNELSVNPCFIIQISNKDKAEEEFQNTILPSLKDIKHQELKWVYITGEDKSCKTNDSGIQKLPVSKWKDYMKNKSSTISVIIFKMVISEGWDIPRACMLYQIRDSKSKQLDEQVMGRVRRNPRLLDFEKLSDKAKLLACTAWIWGIIPEDKSATRQVKLYKDYGIEKEFRIKPTKLQNINDSKSLDLENFVKNLKDDRVTHSSIFDLYKNINHSNNDIQSMCYQYSDSYEKWRLFTENLSNIKTTYNEYICDYEKTMFVCEDVSFPYNSCYIGTDDTLNLNDWIWCRKDSETDFSFDSYAEKRWAEELKDIRSSSIQEVKDLTSTKFLWGKNYPFNSEVKFEYYLDGIHSSYPDFVMKDKNGFIHIFEVKSVNVSNKIKLDEKEYKEKIKALENCYKECSKKTGHFFYLPILDNNIWKITRFIDGNKDEITLEQFKAFLVN
ncbi:MAG: DEAD/DEAH box helicase family protein [Treponemataceae bacterium]|nr:DEAD/DEAH box helicase family protein [Treponemataceae bacterium]